MTVEEVRSLQARHMRKVRANGWWGAFRFDAEKSRGHGICPKCFNTGALENGRRCSHGI